MDFLKTSWSAREFSSFRPRIWLRPTSIASLDCFRYFQTEKWSGLCVTTKDTCQIRGLKRQKFQCGPTNFSCLKVVIPFYRSPA
jgi:hypothetical protein